MGSVYMRDFQWNYNHDTGEIYRIELKNGLYPHGYDCTNNFNLDPHNIQAVMERLHQLEAKVARLELAAIRPTPKEH